MPRPASSTPTEGELDILQVLWQLGPSTVRQIHNVLKEKRGTGYSTTLKAIQIMTEKGLLLKDDAVRPQVYRTAETQEETELALVDDLIQRGFGGSAMSLVLRAASAERISPRELAQIKRLIEKAKGDQP
jgi:BlaI family transcriptional regulator, penicillinase repressor